MKYKDYYEALGLKKDATKAQIKSAYRKMAKKYHPDLNQGDDKAQEKFKEINEAYEVLSDDKKRQQYDTFGSAEGFSGGQNFNPEDFGFGNATYTSSNSGDFSDFFNTIFGGGGSSDRRSSRRSSGFGGFSDMFSGGGMNFGSSRKAPSKQKYETSITVTLEELYKGTSKNLYLTINNKNEDIPLKIPKGLLPGKRIKINGDKFNLDGDIFVKVNVIDSENRLDGVDVIKSVNISPWDAYFGTKKQVETLTGKILVTVPEKVKNGQKIRIAKKGFVDMKNNTGDLYLEFVIENPELTEEQVKLYKDLQDLEKK